MKAMDLYREGKLAEAVEAATVEVRTRPADVAARGRLVALLCIQGELDRADKQIETIVLQDPKSEVGASLIRQLIRAERWRQEFWLAGRLPEFVGAPSELLQLHLRAAISLREGDRRQAGAWLVQAEELRSPIVGEDFDDFRDLDDRVANLLEVLTSNGKYYWIPIDRVNRIEVRQPEQLLDHLWVRAGVSVADGPEGEVYLPAIYAPSTPELDAGSRMGRTTDWSGDDGEPVCGRGLRMFFVGEVERSVFELGRCIFANGRAPRPEGAGSVRP